MYPETFRRHYNGFGEQADWPNERKTSSRKHQLSNPVFNAICLHILKDFV